MELDLKVLTNTSRGFYQLLGPFLSRREVVKTVGGPVWDDDAKTWLVLVRHRQVLGFVGVADRAGRTVVESLYVVNRRHARVAAELVGAVVDRFGRQELHATVARDQTGPYLTAGFVETGGTAGFARLTREATR